MIVRELVTMFGVDFDESGANRADQRISALKNTLAAVGLGVSFAGVFSALNGLVHAASGVEEEMNVISTTFGEATDDVLHWADTFGAAMGRSKYDMAKYAGQMGAVLAPMMQGVKSSATDIADTIEQFGAFGPYVDLFRTGTDSVTAMSEALGSLSVDIGSFYNEKDEETLVRLRAAMLGSTQVVDQFGINLREEHVQAVMAEAGLKKKFKTMSEGEKVQMRFLTIMKDSKLVQGDAAKTINSYANTLKVLEAKLKDAAIAAGEKLMPAAKATTGVLADMATWMLDVTKNSHAVEAALTAVGGVLTVYAGGFLIANAGAVLFIAGAMLLIGALEDVYTSLEGGEGYFKDFFVAVMGEDSWHQVLEFWKKMRTELGDIIWETMHPEEMMRRRGGELSGSEQAKVAERVAEFKRNNPNADSDDIARVEANAALGMAARKKRDAALRAEQARAMGVGYGAEDIDNAEVTGRDKARAETEDKFDADKRQADQFQATLNATLGLKALGDTTDEAARVVGGTIGKVNDSLMGLHDRIQTVLAPLDDAAAHFQQFGPNGPVGPEVVRAVVPTTVQPQGGAGFTPAAGSQTNVYRGGDFIFTAGPGTQPDTVREMERAGRRLIADQNRSMAESASERE